MKQADELLDSQDKEITRLRAALEQLAAGYVSPPCTMAEGHYHLSVEFKRRMRIASDALA